MKRTGFLLLGVLLYGGAEAADWPEVTEAAVAELGATPGTPQMNGFVFIEGRYIAPPYAVSRKGNGIFINRIQIEQPQPWPLSAAPGTGPAADAPPVKKALDADGDFEEVGTAAEAKPAVAAAEPVAAEPAKPRSVQSIDELFEEDAPAKPAPVAAAPVVAELTPEDLKRQKEALVANLERLRKGYEQALIQNEVFFFGFRQNRVNGNYGTARTLMGVLPKALRQAQSPQDLMQRLNQGGVYFLDLRICAAVFKNKGAFPLLEDRLAKIEEYEALELMKRKPAPNR